MKYIAKSIEFVALLAFVSVMTIYVSYWFLITLMFVPSLLVFDDDRKRQFPKNLDRICKEEAIKTYCDRIDQMKLSAFDKIMLKARANKDVAEYARKLPKDYAEQILCPKDDKSIF